ncbi:MAG TPA: VOC family protein, partial [Gemmatimonadota bacterium]|nr:VOC family protein [Gemmatimonadota bacterium]
MAESGRGKFVWYELMTTDTEAAKAFYSDVVGWSTA